MRTEEEKREEMESKGVAVQRVSRRCWQIICAEMAEEERDKSLQVRAWGRYACRRMPWRRDGRMEIEST